MTTNKSQACGLKSWVLGHAKLPANANNLDLKESKGLSAEQCFNNFRACLPFGQQERNAH